ncbi:MAG: OmpH family outer membrane protein [Muribaculaceae bacterium]|nr:OmpH family outer membrane protein [Muribaculaceae bacterium]
MKILVKSFGMFIALMAMTCVASCTVDNKDKNEASSENAVGVTTMLNIRYIDKDSLIRNYNLAKDLNEVMLRTQTNYENAARQKSAEIQKFAASIETKYKNNGYLSEASFNADQQKLQKMQQDAQNYMANLERSIQDEMLQNNIQLNDSVDNFIKSYNKEKGYEIIFSKDATLFIDSKYDITEEVIKGLNERYNKVENK